MHATATRDDASHATARELALLAALIALANAPLLAGGAWLALLFVPAHVAAGEWWRVATGQNGPARGSLLESTPATDYYECSDKP